MLNQASHQSRGVDTARKIHSRVASSGVSVKSGKSSIKSRGLSETSYEKFKQFRANLNNKIKKEKDKPSAKPSQREGRGRAFNKINIEDQSPPNLFEDFASPAQANIALTERQLKMVSDQK